jgi:hypothetical protein
MRYPYAIRAIGVVFFSKDLHVCACAPWSDSYWLPIMHCARTRDVIRLLTSREVVMCRSACFLEPLWRSSLEATDGGAVPSLPWFIIG